MDFFLLQSEGETYPEDVTDREAIIGFLEVYSRIL